MRKLAEQIKEAFEEGYNSYKTPANAYNTVEEAWEESKAKEVYDKLLSRGVYDGIVSRG